MIDTRVFEERDAARLAAFMKHWGELPELPGGDLILRHVRHCRSNVSGELFLAAQKRNGAEQLVGYLQMCEVSLVGFEPSAEVTAILVHEKMRGQGIGGKLMERAKKWTREKGLTRLVVTSQTYRKDAHRFYDRHGFKSWKESTFYSFDLGPLSR